MKPKNFLQDVFSKNHLNIIFQTTYYITNEIEYLSNLLIVDSL